MATTGKRVRDAKHYWRKQGLVAPDISIDRRKGGPAVSLPKLNFIKKK